MKRLVYTNENGEIVKGVCSNFLCKNAKLQASLFNSMYFENGGILGSHYSFKICNNMQNTKKDASVNVTF